MRENTTPLAGAFFRMVFAGGILGAAIVFVSAVAGGFSPTPWWGAILSWAPVFGFFMGLVVAASAAGPAVGVHAWAAAKAPRLRILAAACGGAVGPVAAVSILLWVSPAEAPVAGIYWALLLPTASLAAVFFTKPLRAPASREAALSGTRV